MKKILNKWGLLMLMLCASFVCISCSSDSDDEDNVSGIIGTWKEDDELNIFGETYLQFKKDGTYFEVTIYDDEDIDVKKSQWEAIGNNKIRVGGGDVVAAFAEVISVSKTDLVLDFAIELRYKKVSDSVIEKYIR